MTGAQPSHVQKAACRCGPPPELCITDDTVLTQHAWSVDKFRAQPRIEVEVAVSLLVGSDWTKESASKYVLRGESPTRRRLARVALRHTTAGALRAAGFAVVHTTGRVRGNPHVSVVWPATRPLQEQLVPWPSEVSARFDACFTGENEA